MQFYPSQYGQVALGSVPFRSITEHTAPEAQFDVLNDALQRTDEERKKNFVSSIMENQNDLEGYKIFSTEPYHITVLSEDLPEGYAAMDLGYLLTMLGPKKMIADGGTRHLAHRMLAAVDALRFESPVLITLHILKNPDNFLLLFAHLNRDRKPLPKSLLDFIDAQTYMKDPTYYPGIPAFLTMRICASSPALHNRVRGPGLKPDQPFVDYSDMCGAFYQAQGVAKFKMNIRTRGRKSQLKVPAENQLPILSTAWEALSKVLHDEMFSKEAFALWMKKGAFGTAITVLLGGALWIARNVTNEGQMADRPTLEGLFYAITKTYAAAFKAELQSANGQSRYSGEMSRHSGDVAIAFIDRLKLIQASR